MTTLTTLSTVANALRLRAFERPVRSLPKRVAEQHALSGEAPRAFAVDGTKACKFIRERFGLVPGVIFGGDPAKSEPRLIAVRERDLKREQMSRRGSLENTLYRLELEDGSSVLAFPRQLTKHVVRDKLIHCAFLKYDPAVGAKLKMPFYFDHEELSPGVKRGGWFNRHISDVWVHIKGEVIPPSITVSLASLDVGDSVTWADLQKAGMVPPSMTLIKRNPRETCTTIATILGKLSLIKAVKAERLSRKKYEEDIAAGRTPTPIVYARVPSDGEIAAQKAKEKGKDKKGGKDKPAAAAPKPK
jgi:large subunit ribosomal protein L25